MRRASSVVVSCLVRISCRRIARSTQPIRGEFAAITTERSLLRGKAHTKRREALQVSRKRGQKLAPFTSLFRHATKSAAWAALSVGARATFFELQENYNTNRQNTVFLSARTGSKKLNAGPKAVLRWMGWL
jgi:hypothetical protein